MTSSLVRASDSMPDRRTASRTAGTSSQPQRRGRPVTNPNSSPALSQQLARLVAQLGRERAVAHAGAVPLGHAQHGVNLGGAEPQPGTGAPGRGRGRGDERIRAVVEVEQHPLRAFEQDVLAPHNPPCGPRVRRRRRQGRISSASARYLAVISAALGGVATQLAYVGADRRQVAVQPRAEAIRAEQVADPQADARRLALVGGANPALGGPDAARAILTQAIDLQMVRKRQVRALGDDEVALALDAPVGRGRCGSRRPARPDRSPSPRPARR